MKALLKRGTYQFRVFAVTQATASMLHGYWVLVLGV